MTNKRVFRWPNHRLQAYRGPLAVSDEREEDRLGHGG